MIALYSFAITIVGAMLAHWAHAGNEDGDRLRRAWARPVSLGVAGVGVLGMVIAAALAAASNYP